MPPQHFAVFFAILVTVYFWWYNIKGLHESSTKALRIMQITTVMVVIFLVWCTLTLLDTRSRAISSPPLPSNLQFSDEGLGWFKGTWWPTIPVVAIIIAFGHSVLSMSGFETLAQVYREIEYPKLKSLKIAGNIVCTYAAISTGGIILLAAMIIPGCCPKELCREPARRTLDAPGRARNCCRLSFHVFRRDRWCVDSFGRGQHVDHRCQRVHEPGGRRRSTGSWFQKPHRRFGTTYRIINLITILQLITVVLSRGQTYLLGEAYAFGIVWSFFLKALSVLVFRFQRHDQEYKTPGNIHNRRHEKFPIGLILTTLVLLFVALANLFSKRIATISGVSFTAILFIIFTISETIPREEIQERQPRAIQSRHAAGNFRRVRFMSGRAAFWSQSAITTGCSICSRFCRRRMSGSTTSWS